MAGPFRKYYIYTLKQHPCPLLEDLFSYSPTVDRQQLDESIHRNLLAGIRPRTVPANTEGAKFHWPKRVSTVSVSAVECSCSSDTPAAGRAEGQI